MATESNHKWIDAFENYLDRFGLVKFAETNSLNMNDFERAFKHYLRILQKRPHGRYHFGEVDNEYFQDFYDSFKTYFE